jgi:xylulokinase
VSLVLACDIGGTLLRVALVDRDGAIVAQRRGGSPAQTDLGASSEVDPENWWKSFNVLAAAVASDAGKRFDDIEAVAICGVTRTQVLLDRHGRAVRPAITWRDTRAEGAAQQLLPRLPADHPERAQINAFHPLARLAWLAEHEPRALAAAVAVIDPKDYLNFRLTGRVATDPISSARLAAAATPGPSGASLLEAAGLREHLLPPRLGPTDQVGRVGASVPRPLARLVGRAVFCLANDTWAAVLGLGALRPGFAYNISGTTDVLGVVSGAPATAEGLMAVGWGAGLHHLGGPSQNGADTVTWLTDLFAPGSGESVGVVLDRLLDAPRDAQPMLILPYLQGERTPHWDAALRGAALGLNRRHTRTDFAWAMLESIAFLNRLVLERAEAALGRAVAEIRFGGGGAANETWCQLKADICERPVAVGEAQEPGLLGCAIAARVGLGQYVSLGVAQEKLVRVARRYRPRGEYAAAYRKLYSLYRAAEAALRPVSHGLAVIDGHGALPGAPAMEKVPQ